MSAPVRAAAASPAFVESRLTTRPVTAADEEFLLTVYASTRLEELAPLGWSNADRDAFLRQQGQAQHHHYRTYYANVDYQIIFVDGRPAGRLYVARWPNEVRIVDIALLPEYRNAGIGTGLLMDLIAEAQAAGMPVSIHVEAFSPARRLYERLGFRLVEDKGLHLCMVLPPQAAPALSEAATEVGNHVG